MKTAKLLYISTLVLMISCSEDKKGHVMNPENYITWKHYLGDPGRSHYSTLDQIDTLNVKNLELAWTYHSGGIEENRTTQIQTNPLVVGNRIYGVNAAIELFAVNAKTGKELWKFSPTSGDNSRLGLNRGLSFWESEGSEPSRIFFSSGPTLFAINPENGTPILSFGENGSIDLRDGLGRDPELLSVVSNTPGAVYNNILIMGTRVGEGPGSSPGHIRAYNTLSGEIEWTFHTIPQPGEYGHDTWPAEAHKTVGGANNWAGMALDESRGIVYIPTGSAAFDWYGGDREGENLFANSLLALNADTGQRIWHFQIVHHDMWDRDLPAPPNLLEVERDGKKIPAVAQVTKSGHVFLFNRVNGDPLFPIEEREYPQSTLEGERAHPTQPLPTKPKPFARQILTENDLYDPERPAFVDDFVDKDQNIDPPTVLDKFRSVTSKGQFIPIDTTGVMLYPGADGGAEWGGAALDPTNGVMYVNSNEMAWIVRMSKVDTGSGAGQGAANTQIHCARCHGGELQGLGAIPELQNVKDRLSIDSIVSVIRKGKGAMPPMPNLTEEEAKGIASFLVGLEEEKHEEPKDHRVEETSIDVPYAVGGFGRFKDDRGYPVVKPPWGTLNAIDLNTGEYLWQIPFGEEEGFEDPKYPISGAENYGGPVITSSGVLFIAATKDEKIRAYSMKSGALLWQDQLPAGGYATPATYQIDGQQFLVIACGGGKMGTKSGDEYRAYALNVSR